MQSSPVPKAPNFTQPNPNWRKAIVKDETLYLPRGISYVKGLWRVTVNSQQQYETTLVKAWHNLSSRKRVDRLYDDPTPCGPVKRIDTGIIGVNASFDIRGTTISLRIHVAQRSQARHANKNITQCAVGELNQAWLDRNLALAAGLRWYTLQLRQEGKLITPLGVRLVPSCWVPSAPVRRASMDEIYQRSREIPHPIDSSGAGATSLTFGWGWIA